MGSQLSFMKTVLNSSIQDLTDLDFSLSLGGSGSAGSFYKAYDEHNYYKASYFLGDVFGYEAVNEVLVSRLADIFGIKNAEYSLVHAEIKIAGKRYITYICKSKNWKEPSEGRITLEMYMGLNDMQKGEISALEGEVYFNDILDMILLDYIIDNRDRHGANIEILMKGSQRRLAPVFDCGSSLLAPCQYNEERISMFNILHDGPVNNYLISIMWGDVLEVLKKYGVRVKKIDWSEFIYDDLYCAIPSYILNKEVEMVKRRYEYAKEILNS